MKQITAVISGIAVILLVLSCGSVDLSKRYPNMVANIDPFPIGSAEAQLDRFLSPKVNTVKIEAIFHPRLNAVALEFKYELATHRLYWNEAARKQFAASLELYKKDFDEKKLINSYRRTRAVYGNVKGRFEWEAFMFAKTHISIPTIDIGYRFKENTPFFSTYTRPAKEFQEDGDNSPAEDSQQFYMYFTRAQADQLVLLFDQDYLMGLVKERTNDIFETSTEADKEAYQTPKDDYYEF
jgi:hypothetical protein